MTKRVLVWLSGWVDSAVSAYLLKEQGYDVTAWFMINYLAPEGEYCPTKEDLEEAKKVANFLEIPFFISSSSRWVYIWVVATLVWPKILWIVLISTSPYLYIRVAAVCLNLWGVYIFGSNPANSIYFFNLNWIDLLEILFLCELKNRAVVFFVHGLSCR